MLNFRGQNQKGHRRCRGLRQLGCFSPTLYAPALGVGEVSSRTTPRAHLRTGGTGGRREHQGTPAPLQQHRAGCAELPAPFCSTPQPPGGLRLPEDSRRGRPGTGTAPGLAPRWHQARSWGGSGSKPRLFGAGCGNPALPPRGARTPCSPGGSDGKGKERGGARARAWRSRDVLARREEEAGLQHPPAAAGLQAESLPRAGARQRPLGWGPREMQPSASPQTPCPTGKERPWAPFGCLGFTWCQQAAAPGVGPRSPQAVARFTASVGRCLYLNPSLCPFKTSKQTLLSSS